MKNRVLCALLVLLCALLPISLLKLTKSISLMLPSEAMF